jgi:mitochondrial fission protein ELM1
MKLSKYFTLGDLSTRPAATSYAVKDQNGLTAAEIVGNLKHLAVNVLDKVKEQYPDMIITSGFRSKNE